MNFPEVTQIENADDYVIGGYHPMFLGEVLQNRYLIKRKLQNTRYSSIWFAVDFKYNLNVCIKVYKSSPYYTEVALLEVKALQTLYKKSKEKEWIYKMKKYKEQFELQNCLRNENFCVKYFNSFVHEGPHGSHICVVYEFLGLTLDQLLLNPRVDYV